MNRVMVALLASIAVAVCLMFLLPNQPTAVTSKIESSNLQSERAGVDMTLAEQPSSNPTDAAIVDDDKGPIVVYCAASNRAVMEKIRQALRTASGSVDSSPIWSFAIVAGFD